MMCSSCCVMFDFSLLDVFPEPAKSFLCKGNNEIMLNLVFEYVAQDLAQHIEASHSITVFSEAYIKVTAILVLLFCLSILIH